MNNNQFPALERIRAWFYRQPSAQQQKIKKYGTICAFGLVALGVYYLTGQNEKNLVLLKSKKTLRRKRMKTSFRTIL